MNVADLCENNSCECGADTGNRKYGGMNRSNNCLNPAFP